MADVNIGNGIYKSTKPQKVLIAIGQSFINGREPMANLNASYAGAINTVGIYDGSGFVTLNSTLNNNQYLGVGAPNYAPSNEYGYTFYLGKDLATYYNEHIWYGQYGLGSSFLGNASFPTWLPTGTGSFCQTLKQHIRNMYDWLRERGITPQFDVIYDQGYADATDQTKADAYAANLETLITTINGYITAYQRTPYWYIVKLAVNYGGLTAPGTIRTAQTNVVNAGTTYRRLIDIDAASLQGGDGHPNDAGNSYIANAIKTAYIADH